MAATTPPTNQTTTAIDDGVVVDDGREAFSSIAKRWYVLVVMVLVYTLSIADRYVISTVLEPIRLELQLTDSGIAFLTGVALALFYVVMGLPLSWLIDRGNRRNIIAWSIIAWSAMTAFCGTAKTYGQLLLGRIGVGIGEAGGTPGASSIISDYFPAARRPMALTVFALGAPIGAWIGADIAGMINDAYDWRTVFLALGVPGVVVGLLIFLTVQEPRRGRLDDKGGDHEGASFLESMRYLWTQRAAVHVMVGSAVTALWGWGLMWWTPTFLIRNYALTPGEAGAITGPIHLVGGGARDAVHGLVARAAVDARSAPDRAHDGLGRPGRDARLVRDLLDAQPDARDVPVLDLHPVDLFLHRAELRPAHEPVRAAHAGAVLRRHAVRR